MGELYTSKEEIPFEKRRCWTCGDWDDLIGYAENREEAWALFDGELDIDGSGGWDVQYVTGLIERAFPE